MRAVIRERRVIPGLLSASGVERIGSYYFVIADDYPDLFSLDADWNLVATTPLFRSDTRRGERIAKQNKPDLEAMCAVEWQGRTELLCFGSGSKSPARDVCYRIDVTDPASPQNVRAVSLTALYDALRANSGIVGAHTLNLEAATTRGDRLLLFQRGNISGINSVMEYDTRAFMEYLDNTTLPVPASKVMVFALPQLRNRYAGFSAASTFGGSILFSASVEDTDNEIDDGATLGSFIGRIDGNELQWICAVEQDSAIAPVKIEGISILEADANGFEILAVTDNDADASEVLHIQIQ